MKNKILFFMFFVFVMISHMQAQDFRYEFNSNGTSYIYPVKPSNNNTVWESVDGSDWHVGNDKEALDVNEKGAGDNDEESYIVAGVYGQVVHVRTTYTPTLPGGNPSYGKRVVVRINRYNSSFYMLYAHLFSINVSEGDIIHPTTIIGKMGKTGLDPSNPLQTSHLHMVLWKNIPNDASSPVYQNVNNGRQPSYGQGHIYSSDDVYTSNEREYYAGKVQTGVYPPTGSTVSLINPENYSTDFDVATDQLSWQAVSGTERYLVQISTNSEVNTQYGGLLNPDIIYQYEYNGTSVNFPVLKGNTTYYWTVRAEKLTGQILKQFSPIRSFTTGIDTRPDIFPSNLEILDKGTLMPITQAKTGDTIRIEARHNISPMSHPSMGSYMRYFISSDNTYTPGYDSMLADRYQNISSGTDYLQDISHGRIPTWLTAGDYYILAFADFQKVHAESNENNNIISIPITITEQVPLVVYQDGSTLYVQYNAPHNEYLSIRIRSLTTYQTIRQIGAYGGHKQTAFYTAGIPTGLYHISVSGATYGYKFKKVIITNN